MNKVKKIDETYKLELRVKALESAVFSLLEKDDLDSCDSCGLKPKNYNELSLIFDTGLCTECYEAGYVEELAKERGR